MSNLLSIPFKRTYTVEIKDAARAYIADHGGVHPDECREDIKTWQSLREEATTDNVHDGGIDAILLYHAQLTSILSKLPPDIHLSIPYAPAFNSSADPVALNNLVYERAALLFNLAALYSQLAAAEDRSAREGITRAASNYQLAAGTLSFTYSSVLPHLVYPANNNEERLLDLSKDFVKGLEWLMLAQAQECSWQLAKLSNYRNSVIAKIAAGTASLYKLAVSTFRSSHVVQALPPDWIAHMESKEFHFSAVAEYRESLVEYEARRYGTEFARLTAARIEAKKAYNIARKGMVAVAVLQDVQSLLETITTHESRAQRDNDLIYHQDVPPSSALLAIQEAKLVTSNIPKGLVNPSSILQSTHPLFSDLVSWGAREAINIYNDRKNNLFQEKLIVPSRELREDADEALRKLNLPSSLDALERPVGLPPSLLRKAEEVRLEDGPSKIQVSIDDVERLAHHNFAILEEALDILDNEASEDESARKDFPLTRPVSHEANVELTEKSNRYRSILAQAAESDGHIRQKWDEWEDSITELTWAEETLEASVPSSTGSLATPSQQNTQTRHRARELRMKLEELDTLHGDCEQLVRRAQSFASSDDIRPRILAASSGFERLTVVTPAMFEDVMDEELVKFDKYLLEMVSVRRRQKELLDEIQRRNKAFLDSRKGDPAVKERELALQSLDLAYAKYREIVKNLDEGFKFYNGLSGILMQFKQVCKQWSHLRNQELRDLKLAGSMQSISIQEDSATPAAQLQSSPQGHSKKVSSKLPPLNASEWEFEEMRLPPAPGGG